jgi:hypothetical protein
MQLLLVQPYLTRAFSLRVSQTACRYASEQQSRGPQPICSEHNAFSYHAAVMRNCQCYAAKHVHTTVVTTLSGRESVVEQHYCSVLTPD